MSFARTEVPHVGYNVNRNSVLIYESFSKSDSNYEMALCVSMDNHYANRNSVHVILVTLPAPLNF
jgi:hypothetical protein